MSEMTKAELKKTIKHYTANGEEETAQRYFQSHKARLRIKAEFIGGK